MNDNDISQEELIYHMMDVQYIMAMGRKVEVGANNDLYPAFWFSNSDYEKKIKVLVEALKKKCLIKDTSEYQDMIEGVDIKEDEEENNEKEEER